MCQKPRETKGDQKGNHEKRGSNRKRTLRKGVLKVVFCCYLRRFRTKPFNNSGRPKGEHEKTDKNSSGFPSPALGCIIIHLVREGEWEREKENETGGEAWDCRFL